jgi:hypothetical protein
MTKKIHITPCPTHEVAEWYWDSRTHPDVDFYRLPSGWTYTRLFTKAARLARCDRYMEYKGRVYKVELKS